MAGAFKKKGGISLVQVLLMIVFVGVLGVAFWRFTMLSGGYTRSTSETRLSEIAQHNAGTIKIEVENSLNSVQMAAEAMGEFGDLHSEEAIARLQEIARYSSFELMRATTPDGESWASKDSKINISDRNYFGYALRGRSGITDLLVSISNGEQIFVGYAPVEHNEIIIGTLHGTYEVKRLLKITGLESFGVHGYSYIIKSDGRQVLSAQSDASFGDGYDNLWDFFAKAEYYDGSSYAQLNTDMQRGGSNFLSYGYEGSRRLAYYTPIGVNDWYILQVVPQEAIDAQAKPINELALVFALEIVAIFVAVGFIIFTNAYKSGKAMAEMNHRLQLGNERFGIAISHSSNIIFDFNVFTGTIEFLTDVSDKFNFPPEDPLSPEYLFHLGILDRTFLAEFKHMFSKIKNGVAEAGCEAKLFLKSGREAWYKISLISLFEGGKPVNAVGIMEDITELKENELRFEKEKQYMNAILLDAIDVYEINLTKNIYQKQRSSGEKTNWECYDDSYVKFVSEKVYVEDREAFTTTAGRQRMLSAFQSNTTQEFFEYRRTDLGSDIMWVSSTSNLLTDPATGDVKAFIYVRDIDERKKSELALRYRAEHDVLTGLYNRTAATRFISAFLQTVGMHGTVHGFLMMDLDGFKQVNDTYGHIAGDELLKLVAKKMCILFRATDIVARLGGDEFVVFLKDAHSEEHIKVKAQELCNLLRGLKPEGTDGGVKGISISIGIAMSPRHSLAFDELYKMADSALYAAKHAGRDRYVVYEDTIEVHSELNGDI